MVSKLGVLDGDAKQKIKEQEAQGLANVFRGRVESSCGELFKQWTVTKFTGDCFKEMLAKIQTSEGRSIDATDPVKATYLHLWVARVGKSNEWECSIALDKSAEDPLDEDDPEFEELQEDEQMCSSDSCAVM